jgi:hypothetical protein
MSQRHACNEVRDLVNVIEFIWVQSLVNVTGCRNKTGMTALRVNLLAFRFGA